MIPAPDEELRSLPLAYQEVQEKQATGLQHTQPLRRCEHMPETSWKLVLQEFGEVLVA